MPFSKTLNPDAHPFDPTTPDSLLYIASCRASPSGIGSLVDCLMDYNPPCIHRLSLGSEAFCIHPKRAGIVAQTETSSAAES